MIKTQNQRCKTKDAFTLIELLITVSIFSIIILGLYSIFHTGVFSYNRLDKSLSLYQTARKIFNRIDLDLKNSFSYSNNETRFMGEKDKISFLTLTGSDFSSVSYEREETNLLRLRKKGIESLKEDISTKPRVLARNIKEIDFSYAFSTGDESIFDWKDEWADADIEKKNLPLAVKINLTLRENSKKGRDVKFEKIIFLAK